MKLFEYQVEPVRHTLCLLRQGQNVFNGSDMGTGKTVMAAAVVKEMARPTLVLAPKISLTAWRRIGDAMGVEFELTNPENVRTGRTAYGTWQFPKPKKPVTKLVCECCQLEIGLLSPACIYGAKGLHCVEVVKVPHNFGKFTWVDEVKFLVVDEVHRYSGRPSQNGSMLIAARRQRIPVLAMSATAADSPLELRALGFVLGLHGLTDFNTFAFKHGARKAPFGGLYFAGDEVERRAQMARLHCEIFPSRGVRVRIADLGTAFPACQITTELYDLEGGLDKIQALYATMDEAIARLRDGRCDEEMEVTRVLHARQELEVRMIPVFEEVIAQFREAGAHVAAFLNFKVAIDEMAKRLKTNCRVEGDTDPAERQNNIDRFNADEEPVILVNSQAGGLALSLPDTRGKHFRAGVVSLGYSSKVTRQVFGRLPRADSVSKSFYRVPLIAGTVQEKIHRAVSAKLNQMDALNDRDLDAANLSLTNLSISSLLNSRL